MEITMNSGPELTNKNDLAETYAAGNKFKTQSGGAVRAAALRKFITFFLNGENYALNIIQVHEIVIAPEITPVPNTPFYIMGVINLRGNIIQIIDMRLKLSMPFRNYDEKNCVIIIKTGHSLTGIVVDRVMEVISERVEKIEEQPSFGFGVDTSYIDGILKNGGKTIFILSVERVFGNGDN